MYRIHFLVSLFCLNQLSTPHAKTHKKHCPGGQSYMDGYGDVNELPASLNEPVSNAMTFQCGPTEKKRHANNAGTWAPLMPGLAIFFKSDSKTNPYSDRFGIQLTFASKQQGQDKLLQLHE